MLRGSLSVVVVFLGGDGDGGGGGGEGGSCGTTLQMTCL